MTALLSLSAVPLYSLSRQPVNHDRHTIKQIELMFSLLNFRIFWSIACLELS